MKYFICLFLLIVPLNNFCQSDENVYVDETGLLRWETSRKIVSLFGVNYTTPFAHSYRAIEQLGFSHKDAIDMDVAHMARLGFNAYRIHMWDREISDTEGNLLENKHLELFDYLLMKLEERGIKIILTPIAWWGPGWPEPDPASPGFSNNYSKEKLTTNSDARIIQKNYIRQVVNHKNKFTDLTYKDDPSIIAFEIINEPDHPEETSIVTAYINEIAKVFRDAGIEKPIFYNISQNWSEAQAAAVYNAEIDGISFQWYPAGLVKYSELKGNYLPHVDKYPIPNSSEKSFLNKARMVYEFDAADVSSPIMYPVMARSFREAGMQWATMFSYDPTVMAKYNTEYNTHFLNLIFTPKKAISLMIASEVFKQVKPYQKFGNYPQTLEFGDFRISYEKQLSELNSDEKFYYSNSTKSEPKNISKLKHIAGAGSSPVVSYNGTGSFFMDKLDDGIWRLELYPDVVWVNNPYGRNSLSKEVARIYSTPSKLIFNLPELNEAFQLLNLQTQKQTTFESEALISPGVYIVSTQQIDDQDNLQFSYNHIGLDEYPSITEYSNEISLIHIPPDPIFFNKHFSIQYEVYTDKIIEDCAVFIRKPGWRNFMKIRSTKITKYGYESEIDLARLGKGKIEYCINFKIDNVEYTYPSAINKNPNSWDFYADKFYEIKALDEDADLLLFTPDKNISNLNYPNVWELVRFASNITYDETITPVLSIDFTNIQKPINEFTFQIELDEGIRSIPLSKYNFLKIKFGDVVQIDSLDINLVDNRMRGNKKRICVSNGEDEIIIPFTELQKSTIVLLPRPYPHFLPYYFEPEESGYKKIHTKDNCLNSVQIGILLNHLEVGNTQANIQIKSISLTTIIR